MNRVRRINDMSETLDKELRHYHRQGHRDHGRGKNPEHMLREAYPAIGPSKARMYKIGHEEATQGMKEHESPYWSKK